MRCVRSAYNSARAKGGHVATREVAHIQETAKKCQVKQTSTKFENKHGIERALTRNFRIAVKNKKNGHFF
jgi:hypothetical protein